MAGYELDFHKIAEQTYSEDELWAAANGFLNSTAHKTTTYKFCFFKALLDNIYNVQGNLELPFSMVFERFAEIYWNLIVKFSLHQMSGTKVTAVEKIIQGCTLKYALSEYTSFEALRPDVKAALCKAVTAQCQRFVVGALCNDTKGMLYGFDKATGTINFQPSGYAFLCKYSYVLTKLNYLEWIKYLEMVNRTESAYALASKLDASSKRNNLSFYQDFLLEKFNQHTCFYCGKPLTTACHVDHFIPWSFVKDDKVWNFVQACPTCNSKKKDVLADKMFLPKLEVRNRELIRMPRLLDQVQEEFAGYNDTKLAGMYASAVFNGFKEGWRPVNVPLAYGVIGE